MKKVQSNSFKLNPIAASIVLAMSAQLVVNVAQAGSGFGLGATATGANYPATYYANSPSGPAPTYVNGVLQKRTDGSGLPVTATSGTMLRKFVDTLPGFGAANANKLGQYIPLAVAEKWVDPNGVTTADDYYEIAAVEFNEKMHSDLPKATHLRGYVQLSTAKNPGKKIALSYPNGNPILDAAGLQVYAYDNPHHLGPVITSTKGTVVRVKFTNYLPVGGKMFLPYDTTLPGAGTGPDGVTYYTQNRAGMHLVGGQAPWISAGSPHQWVAPAGETAAYAAGLGKGSSSQSATDMLDPGNGSVNLVFPNDMSSRFTFIQDSTSGMTHLNAYAGLEAAYVIKDPIEQTLISGGTLSGGGLKAPVTVAAGTIPAAELPLILEDKTFVPANIVQQDALWDTANWGAVGDLWFPHVYEPNQDPNQIGGANPVGRWDYGPLFWPIFPVHPAKAVLPSPTFVPEAYMDTPLVNGTAYPTVTVEPKAYRVRVLNGSNDRYYNLGLYVADPTATAAPLLDANGNPVVNAAGVQQYMANTEVKMVPAAAINAAGNPPGWDAVNNVQLPLPQFPVFPWNINAEPSGPSRAWPIDGRIGGAPDPTTSGPDFVVIGNDGGLLPQATDIPPQPVTYEQNRRSITVLNIYGYGLLLGPSERADTIVDFSAYAGKTLIMYNDAPAPTPFNDPRNDYFTGDPDYTGQGGAYSTQAGYGPNTRTIMQVIVGTAVTTGGPLNAAALATALPAAYAASQPAPIVPESIYNAAFGTTDVDNYGRVATGSAAQPNLIVNHSVGSGVILGCAATAPVGCQDITLVTSGGVGTGSGSGYISAPQVQLIGGGGTGATASATINTVGQVSGVTLTSIGTGYTSAPSVTFVPNNSISGVVVNDGGSGYASPVTVTLSGGGLTGPTVVPANVTLASSATVSTAVAPAIGAATVTAAGSGYLVPPTVSFTASGVPGAVAATGVATISTSPLFVGAAALKTAGTTNYTNPTALVSASQNGTTASASPVVGYNLAPISLPATGLLSSTSTGFDLASVGVNFAPAATQAAGVTAVLPTATVTLDAITGAATAITLLTPGSGMTALPTVTIQDGLNNSVVVPVANLSFAAATGQIFGATITNGGTGYTAPATITFTDATGSGATFTANPASATVGTVTGLSITTGGTGYTAAPQVIFTDKTTGSVHPAGTTAAAATVSLANATGSIVAVTLTSMPAPAAFASGVAGFTSAPAISFTGGGSGALATVGIAPQGVGAQASVTTSSSAAIPVLTKAEQELYDDYGRYNSTGGVELPFTTAAIQTTIPLNYIDSPTDILGDDEMQVWKLVDNGFWSNSIHFSGWDVQLINRVGWDGTVKPPASNEVGWKDTVRLNPLEDAIVAMRATTPKVNFGQPRSTRLQDPSKPAGTGNYPTAPALAVAGTQYASGMGFTADPNVVTQAITMNSAVVGVGTVLLSTSTNTAALPGSTTGNYDNEFIWGSVVLGHAGNDFTRPVVFNPIVTTPSTPTGFGDPTGVGTLSWTDPTPVGQLASAAGVVPVLTATAANPQNEIGFKVLQSKLTLTGGKYVPGAFTPAAKPFAAVPANVVSYKEPAALLAPTTPITGPFYAYEVVAFNAAGDSAPSAPWNEAPPDAPTSMNGVALLTPSFITPATTSTDVKLTLNWSDNAVNETGYTITKIGGPGATLNAATGHVTGGTTTTIAAPAQPLPISANTTFVDPNALVEGAPYEYDLVAYNSFGVSAPVLWGSLVAPTSIPLAPSGLVATPTLVTCPATVPVRCAPDDVVLTWTDNAFNETGYQVFRDGNQIGTIAGTTPAISVPGNALNTTGVTLTYTDKTAQEGVGYTYTVKAVNASGASLATATTPALTVLTVNAATLPTNLVATPTTAPLVNGVYPDATALTWNDNAYTESSYQVTRAVAAVQPNPAANPLVASIPPVTFSASANGANNPMGTKTASWTASPTASYADSGLIDGVAYTWTVAGINSAGTSAAAATVTKTMPGIYIIPPANLIATPNRAGSSIGLQWTDMSTNETDFLVEEQVSTDGGKTFYSAATGGVLNGWSVALNGVVARTAAQTAATGGLVNFNRANLRTVVGDIYNFRVSARNLASFSDSHPYLITQASLAAPVLTAAPTLAVPTFAAATRRVTLNWTAVTPPAGTTISYIVNVGGVQVRTNTLTFNYRPTTAALTAGISYTVQAVATAIRVANPTVFGSTTGPLSNAQTVKLTVPAVMAAPAASAPVVAGVNYTSNLTWPAVAGATGYVITPTLNGVAQAVINVAGGTTVTSRVTLAAGNIYTYTIAATNTAGTGAASPAVTVNTPAAANAGLATVLGAAGSKAITVNWTNASINLTATPFTVQRRTVTAGNVAGAWVTITPTITKTATGYTFTDATGVTGTGYSYHILANGAGGASAYSAATARAVAP